jgi:pimeloyl-ACP methyl ester carboxylesterase
MKAQLNDLDIAYTDQGKGAAILFIHGYPLSKAMWEPQVKDLLGNFSVIAVDLRAMESPVLRCGFVRWRCLRTISGRC